VTANNSLFIQIDRTIKDIDYHHHQKREEAIQALLKKSSLKFREDPKLKQLRLLNNPEDPTRQGLIAVNT